MKTDFQICCHSSAAYRWSAFSNLRCQGPFLRPIASRCMGYCQQREREGVLPIGIAETVVKKRPPQIKVNPFNVFVSSVLRYTLNFSFLCFQSTTRKTETFCLCNFLPSTIGRHLLLTQDKTISLFTPKNTCPSEFNSVKPFVK